METTSFSWRLCERCIKLWPFQYIRKWNIINIKRYKTFYLLSICSGLVIWFFFQKSLLHPSFTQNEKPSSNAIEKPIQQLLSSNVIRERYKLMDEYLRESVTPRNPPFKKIVLWNSAFVSYMENMLIKMRSCKE